MDTPIPPPSRADAARDYALQGTPYLHNEEDRVRPVSRRVVRVSQEADFLAGAAWAIERSAQVGLDITADESGCCRELAEQIAAAIRRI